MVLENEKLLLWFMTKLKILHPSMLSPSDGPVPMEEIKVHSFGFALPCLNLTLIHFTD